MTIKTKLAITTLLAAFLAVVSITETSNASKDNTKKIILTKDNTLVIGDVIDGTSVSEVISKARELDKNSNKILSNDKNRIYLFIRSPGGEIQAGFEMLEALKGLNRPVDTITSFGASMAFQTCQQLGTRYILKTGVLMSHRGRGEFSGEFGGQRPSQTDSRKGLWESRTDEMDKHTVSRTNGKQTLESYQKAYASELWVTGSQAVEQGYADEVVTVKCGESLSGFTTKSANFMGMNISYDMDNCPLNSTPTNVRISDISTNQGSKKLDEFLKEGGQFGSTCLMEAGVNKKKLCATDTNLNLEYLDQVKNQFKTQRENIKDRAKSY